MTKWVVLKFGGTSVSSRQRWDTIAAVLRDRVESGLRPLVVCSALSGVSNALETLIRMALAGEHDVEFAAIEARHLAMAADLGLGNTTVLDGDLAALRQLCLGISLVTEASPRIRAQVMARGELMSTRLGAEFLRSQGIETAWRDARDMLVSTDPPEMPLERRMLSAHFDNEADPELAESLARLDADVVLTQGFVARDVSGETVLLGRGGSDTSAALLAARVGATRCEIWTDVPGMYSANPHEIPSARLLRALGYDEAQEIATTGAKVLHPRCIAPLRAHSIPLHIRCTQHPQIEGTVVTRGGSGDGAQLKAVSSKARVTLVSMDTVGMWQQVGFLADVFACFKALGLSVDLVSTSETNVTVSLDPSANLLSDAVLEDLERALASYCRVRVIDRCAAVSLVGRKVRAIMHKLGEALEIFEEHRVHLVSQAASDLNLTFVVDEEQAPRLVRQLHAELLAVQGAPQLFGPTWQDVFSPTRTNERANAWWVRRRDALLDAAAATTPAFVYDAGTLRAAARRLSGLESVNTVFFAMKANPNKEILRLFEAEGLGFECVSPGELARVFDLFGEIDPRRVLFTPNFAPREEYEAAFERGVLVTLDNLHPLTQWPEVFAGRDVMVRVDPGRGRGITNT